MNRKIVPFFLSRQPDEDFVSLAEHFRRERQNVISGNYKHRRFFSANQVMKVPKTRLAVPASPLLPSPERFIYFVNPQNTGSKGFCDLNHWQVRDSDSPTKPQITAQHPTVVGANDVRSPLLSKICQFPESPLATRG